MSRFGRSAVGVGLVSLLAGGLVALTGGPGTAGTYTESGTYAIKAHCNPDGTATSQVTITENFTGLVLSPPYSYEAVANRDTATDSTTISESSWYPDPDGTHSITEDEFAYGTAPTVLVKAGDTYHWQLIRTYGANTTVLEGDIAVGGPTCVKKPNPATYAVSPDSVRVKSDRSFHFEFKAKPGLKAHVVVTRNDNTLAKTDTTVPSDGTANPRLVLTKTAFHHLENVGKETVRVTVTVTNKAGGKATSHTSLILKAPLT